MQLYVPEDESMITERCNPRGLQGYFSLPQHEEWLWTLGEQFMIFKTIALPPVVWVKFIHPTMQLYVPEDESMITPRCNPRGLQVYFSLPQHVEWLWSFPSLVSGSYQGFLPWE
jgi:hypothetical protein